MNNIAVFSTAFLPPIEYMKMIVQSEQIYMETHEHYQKQSYRNRCIIQTANGLFTMSIPVKHSSSKMLIREVEIDYKTTWQNRFWKALKTAYNTTPFFLYYSDCFEPFFAKKYDLLFDYNEQLLFLILKLLNLKKEIHYTDFYITEYENNILDLRHKIHPKKKADISIADVLFNYGNESLQILTTHKN
jgi:hypothetical protein